MRVTTSPVALLLLFLAQLGAVGVGHAQTSPAVVPTSAVPTTKILAMGRILAPRGSEKLKPIMPAEVRATVDLYLTGKIDQWYVKQDQTGVVFIMNVTTVEDAHKLLEALPLGKAKLMEFDLIPIGPLNPLRLLLSR